MFCHWISKRIVFNARMFFRYRYKIRVLDSHIFSQSTDSGFNRMIAPVSAKKCCQGESQESRMCIPAQKYTHLSPLAVFCCCEVATNFVLILQDRFIRVEEWLFEINSQSKFNGISDLANTVVLFDGPVWIGARLLSSTEIPDSKVHGARTQAGPMLATLIPRVTRYWEHNKYQYISK